MLPRGVWAPKKAFHLQTNSSFILGDKIAGFGLGVRGACRKVPLKEQPERESAHVSAFLRCEILWEELPSPLHAGPHP